MSLFVSSAYPDFAYWTMSGEAVFMILLGGISTFFGPLVGAITLLLLNDVVTRMTEHYNLVLGIVIFGSYLAMVHGVQQLAAEAARRSVAGLNDAERTSLAAGYVSSNAASYPLIAAGHLTVTCAASGF